MFASKPRGSLPRGNSVKMFGFNTSGFLPNQKRKDLTQRSEGSFRVFPAWGSELARSYILRGSGEVTERKKGCLLFFLKLLSLKKPPVVLTDSAAERTCWPELFRDL